jgi:perosamine synthetase
LNKYKIPVSEPEIGDEELQNVIDAVKSGWVSSKGSFIEKFEKDFPSYIGVRHGLTTSNGTAALHLAIVALGIGKGDNVQVPSLSFISVANAVTYTGAQPVFVDSHPEYWCMDPSRLEKSIDSKTKAIIAVHLYGHPCDMDEIMRIAEKHKLHVIEDCAEAHGAEYKGKKVGSFGTISCFSFYGNKIITTGEGGMCVTNNEELIERMRIFRDHGMNPNKKFWHDTVGFNYRMTNLQAALGVAQLKKIDLLIAKKRHIAATYKKLLLDMISIGFPPEMIWAKNTYWLFSILLTNKALREKIIEQLERQGIETRPFFNPIHILPPYKSKLELSVAEELSATGLNLPSGPRLSESQIEEVAESLKETVGDANLPFGPLSARRMFNAQ